MKITCEKRGKSYHFSFPQSGKILDFENSRKISFKLEFRKKLKFTNKSRICLK